METIDVESTELVTVEENTPVDLQVNSQMGFDKLMEVAEMLAKSTIVPINYQNRPENTFLALDMANRMGVSPFIVMQNLHIINGKPSFSGSAIASMIRSNPKFKNVELNYVGDENADTYGAYITAENVSTGKVIKGATVTIATAKKEGWYQKAGSKWQTMPEIMLAYRAYAWFGRVHIPEIMMGLHASEEILDLPNKDNVQVLKNPFKKEVE